MVTPEEGITGELAVISEEYLASAETFENRIAVVDGSNLPPLREYDWSAYARLGFEAVIVTHRKGLDRIEWHRDPVGEMVDGVPINFVRLAADPAILEHEGQTVTIHVKTRYREVPAPTVAGLLVSGQDPTAPRGSDQLLVVHAPYDAASLLPDRSPGVLGAANLAILEQAIAPVVEQRGDLQRDVLFVATGGRSVGSQGLLRLLSAIGPRGEAANTLAKLRERSDQHASRLEMVRQILELFEDASFLREVEASQAGIDALEAEAGEFFTEQVRYTVNERLIEFGEVLLEEQLDFIRAGEDPTSEAFYTYQRIKRRYETISSIAGYPPDQVVERWNRDEQLSSNLDLRPDRRAALREAGGVPPPRARAGRGGARVPRSGHRLRADLRRHARRRADRRRGAEHGTDVLARSGLRIVHPAAIETVTRDLGPVFSELFRRGVQEVAREDAETSYAIRCPQSAASAQDFAHARASATGPGGVELFWLPRGGADSYRSAQRLSGRGFAGEHWNELAAASVSPHARVFGETLLSMAYGAGALPPGRSPKPTDFTGPSMPPRWAEASCPPTPSRMRWSSRAPIREFYLYDGHFGFPITRDDPYGRYASAT